MSNALTGKTLTVEELYKRLEDLIILGYGDKKVIIYAPGSGSRFCTSAEYCGEYDWVEVTGC